MTIDVDECLYTADDIESYIRSNYHRGSDTRPDAELPLMEDRHYIIPADMDYYIWWRTRIRNGEYPEGNRQMTAFFFRELTVMDESHEAIEGWFRVFEKEYDGEEAGDTAYTYHIRWMLMRNECPGRLRAVPAAAERLGYEVLLAGPSIELREEDVTDILGERVQLPDGAVAFLSRVLENIASDLWEERDMGIVEFLSNYREECVADPFTDDIGRMRHMFIMDRPLMNGLAYSRLADIILHSMSLYSPGSFRSMHSVNEWIKRIVKRTLKHPDAERPAEWLPSRTLCTYPYDGRMLSGEYQRSDGTRTFDRSPLLLRVPSERCEIYDGHELDQIVIRCIDNTFVKECRYIPSKHSRPLFSEMDAYQMCYFLYWRSETEKGNYHDADCGHISLRLVELLSRGWDAKRTLGIMLGLAEAYPCPLTMETCMSYALVNGLDLPPFDGCLLGEGWHMIFAADALRRNPIREISPKTIACIDGDRINPGYLDADCVRLRKTMNRILRGFDRKERERTGKRICELAGTGDRRTVRVTVYWSLRRYGFMKDVDVPIDDCFGCGRVKDIIAVTLYASVRHVCRMNDCPMPRMPKTTGRELESQAESMLRRLGS